MATLAIAAVGYAAGSALGAAAGWSAAAIATAASVGASIGGTIGSYVDSTYLYPAIFGKDKSSLTGPRIDDFQLTTASPGSPAHYILGRQNRIPGAFIWFSPVKEVKEEDDEGGGKGGGGTTVIRYKYFVSFAIALCEGPITAVRRIFADGKVIYDGTVSPPKKSKGYKSISIYRGSNTQDPDPVIESFDGVGTVPAYRGTAYIVFEKFALHKFGNRMPNFGIEVEAQSQLLLSDAVSLIMQRAGRLPAEFNTDALRGDEVRGYAIVGPQTPIKQLEPLMLAYDVVVQEKSGVMHFVPRSSIAPVEIPLFKMAAREEGQEPGGRRFSVSEKPGFDLPAEVDVQYLDPNMDLQRNSQREIMQDPPAPTVNTVDIPIVMTSGLAKSIARRILWQAWGNRSEITMTLPPSEAMPLLEADVLQWTDKYGNPWRARIVSIRRGHNWLYELSMVSEQEHTLSASATYPPVTTPVTPDQPTSNPGNDEEEDPVAPPGSGPGEDIPVGEGEELPEELTSDQTLQLSRGVVYDLPAALSVRGSNITIEAIGSGAAPVVRCAAGGVRAASQITNLTITGIRFVCTGDQLAAGQKVGIDIRQRFDGIVIEDCTIESFNDNIVVHHNAYVSAPEAQWGSVEIRRCRILNAWSPRQFEGQGLYIANADGVTIEDNWFDYNGWRIGKPIGIYKHGIYASHLNKNFTIRRNVFARSGSYGIQIRTGAAAVYENAFLDNALGCLLNGDETIPFERNVVWTKHVHTAVDENGNLRWPTGKGGLDWHVQDGIVKNNLFVGGPPRPAGYYVPPAINVSARSDSWAYVGSTSATGTNNKVVNWEGLAKFGDVAAPTTASIVFDNDAITEWLNDNRPTVDPTGLAADILDIIRDACSFTLV